MLVYLRVHKVYIYIYTYTHAVLVFARRLNCLRERQVFRGRKTESRVRERDYAACSCKIRVYIRRRIMCERARIKHAPESRGRVIARDVALHWNVVGIYVPICIYARVWLHTHTHAGEIMVYAFGS